MYPSEEDVGESSLTTGRLAVFKSLCMHNVKISTIIHLLTKELNDDTVKNVMKSCR